MSEVSKIFKSLVLLTILFCAFLPNVIAQKWPVYAKHGMVVSTERMASEIGVDILRRGGNAIDAAVAVGFALAVVHPAAGNIGGGGFMVIRLADGTTTTIDYREKAPLAATETMFLDDHGELIPGLNHDSYLAVGVPGTVAGLTLALEKFGTLSLAEVMAPAIALAENGIVVSYAMSRDLAARAETFLNHPASARLFLKDGEKAVAFGDTLIQQDLAATLRRISEKGRSGFYGGETAERIAADMQAHGGLITKADLAAYQAVERAPVEVTYRGYKVVGMPPPSSGGVTLALMLNMLEKDDLAAHGHNSAGYIHLLTEVMRRAFAARARYLGDADFNPDLPLQKLLSKDYAAELRHTIDLRHASESRPEKFEEFQRPSETTHFSVVDAAGNAGSNTYTIEQWYGSKIVAEDLGFIYNNEMGDFNSVPGRTDTTGLIGTEPNLIAAGKRMLSSMCPVILTRDGELFAVLGSPAGRAIINIVMQTILNLVDFGMNIQDAIAAPRFHHQWLPDRLKIEKRGTTRDSAKLLREMGHQIEWLERKPGHAHPAGRVMGIAVDADSGFLTGAADARSPNRAAVGY